MALRILFALRFLEEGQGRGAVMQLLGGQSSESRDLGGPPLPDAHRSPTSLAGVWLTRRPGCPRLGVLGRGPYLLVACPLVNVSHVPSGVFQGGSWSPGCTRLCARIAWNYLVLEGWLANSSLWLFLWEFPLKVGLVDRSRLTSPVPLGFWCSAQGPPTDAMPAPQA